MVVNVQNSSIDRSAEPLVTEELCLIKIDEERLRAKLSAWNGGSVSEEEVSGWLNDIGFLRMGRLWICEPEAICMLDPSEVQAMCRWPAARHADAQRDSE